MEKERSANPPAGTEPIDGSMIAPSLSREIVTPARIEAMMGMAESILQTNGVKSTVNGVPARVSEFSFPIRMPYVGSEEGKVFYARAAKYIHENGAKKQGEKILPTVVFDETPSLPVITPNPNAVRFSELFKGFGLLVDIDEVDPELNDPRHVNFLMEVLLNLAQDVQSKAEAQKAEERTRLEHATQQHKAEEQRLKKERKVRRQHLAKRIKRVGGKVLGWAAAGSAAGGVVALAIYGIGKIDLSHQDYDERKYTLAGGTELTLGGGSAGHPEFSRQLYEDKLLAAHTMPSLSTSEDSGYGNSVDLSLDFTDTLRQIILLSSNLGKNCATAKVDRVPLDTRLVAWTDFAGPDGISRADEITVNYSTDGIRVCWNGEERNPDDDPRVVVKLRPAAESQPR